MKIRMGFVSNSSSSSFVLMTTKENYERALKEANPFVAAVAKAMFSLSERKFLGKEIVVTDGWTDMGGNSNWDYIEVDLSSVPEEIANKYDGKDYYTAFDEFEVLLGKDEVYSHSTDH
jgi:hypothetical protein